MREQDGANGDFILGTDKKTEAIHGRWTDQTDSDEVLHRSYSHGHRKIDHHEYSGRRESHPVTVYISRMGDVETKICQ
jgi:hypothetical protein